MELKKNTKTKKLIVLLEKDFMNITDKYGFNTEDHNKIFDRISEILDSISIDEYLKTKEPKQPESSGLKGDKPFYVG